MPDRSANVPLREAIANLGEIRARMAAVTMFRGYRAVPVAATGVLAILASFVQAAWLPAPESRLDWYLALWVGVAAVNFAVVAAELARRFAASDSALARQGILQAAERFMPCVVAGALVTMSLVRFSPASAALLPGLWAVLFSLGIFASCGGLPKACLLIGGFYMAAGVVTLTFARGEHALSPYAMGVTFGVGQLATAAILYLALERNDAQAE